MIVKVLRKYLFDNQALVVWYGLKLSRVFCFQTLPMLTRVLLPSPLFLSQSLVPVLTLSKFILEKSGGKQRELIIVKMNCQVIY